MQSNLMLTHHVAYAGRDLGLGQLRLPDDLAGDELELDLNQRHAALHFGKDLGDEERGRQNQACLLDPRHIALVEIHGNMSVPLTNSCAAEAII